MRAFQPIAGRTKRKPGRPSWVAPLAMRRVAWLIAIAAILLQFVLLLRMLYYPAYGFAHIRSGWHLEFAFLILQFCCIPIITARPSRPKKKHIPDPALSIRPR
jgi:hypothetical protein